MLIVTRNRLRWSLDVFMTTWHSLIRNARDPYRPERHYMRGPGPKWHAKHQGRMVRRAI
jgi:hypothetical protein